MRPMQCRKTPHSLTVLVNVAKVTLYDYIYISFSPRGVR
ncbi:MAG: hypothetical protein UW20_C0005G0001 [Candidatus Woesebacteria bacterium GW2011_GWB1_44_11]|uniref:Uncharacterized protein n=1 Tax=Candidatus Woesebacteria bacterium GW2011_GWB1_44_11 TaxID=1618579 RepID=A0A837I890_9BACT|nr:MAG: hypothetical protein UW20_C0005G0001 [Candidatus Woesebacteria bacterium GW2011_GWB1_44_11]